MASLFFLWLCFPITQKQRARPPELVGKLCGGHDALNHTAAIDI